MAKSDDAVTKLVGGGGDGSPEADGQLVALVYKELKRLARRYMDNERSNHTLQPTALVNEAYIRLFAKGSPTWRSRPHFLAHAAVAMRQVLVDQARAHRANKRGGKVVTVSLDEVFAAPVEAEGRQAKEMEPRHDESTRLALLAAELIDLDMALDELARRDPRQAKIVELRYFGGLAELEIVAFLGISESTVRRDLRMAIPWLSRRLKRGR